MTAWLTGRQAAAGPPFFAPLAVLAFFATRIRAASLAFPGATKTVHAAGLEMTVVLKDPILGRVIQFTRYDASMLDRNKAVKGWKQVANTLRVLKLIAPRVNKMLIHVAILW